MPDDVVADVEAAMDLEAGKGSADSANRASSHIEQRDRARLVIGSDSALEPQDNLGVAADIPVDLPRKLLVIGSSVCTGAGASQPTELGWAAKLAQIAETRQIGYENHGVSGTTVNVWMSEVRTDAAHSVLQRVGVVLLSLSLGNEGLSLQNTEGGISQLERHYLAGLRDISLGLRKRMLPGARLVLGGPYANDGYDEAHFAAIQRVLAEMRTWEEVDHVIDFLRPEAQDGHGRWHRGCSIDPGHPNDAGHDQMFQCVDAAEVFGELWRV